MATFTPQFYRHRYIRSMTREELIEALEHVLSERPPRGPRQSEHDRFWSKVDKSPGHGPNGDCWLWTASTNKRTGHGWFSQYRKPPTPAHRWAWIETNGAIPHDLCVCHRCDFSTCVRPDHMFIGTKAENNFDRHEKGRSFRVLTDQQVQEIKAAQGTHKSIATAYGVSQGHVTNIKNGKRCGSKLTKYPSLTM